MNGALEFRTAIRDALAEGFELVRFGNKFFDDERPWVTRESDPAACANTLYQCVQIAANLAVLLAPFLPFSCAKVRGWLDLSADWRPQWVPAGAIIPEPELLFTRLDKKIADEEVAKLTAGQGSSIM